MGKNVEHIQHIKSNVVLEGKPKLPQPGVLVEGELAINYAKGLETISIENASGEVVTFSSDNYYTEQKLGSGFTGENSAVTVTDVIEENEEIISAALTDLDERKLDTSAYTPTEELWVSGTGANAVVQKGSSGTASGDYSVAEGYKTSATTYHAHAEGLLTSASGTASHAEGYITSATTYASHAEGYGTFVNGDYAHAEGWNTVASGKSSHAEGERTTASTNNSHAEGEGTTASGRISHAEGENTMASGRASHTEGQWTIAINNASHAEGQSTSATSYASHAEGQGTIASGSYSHSEGQGTIATGQSSHVEGYNSKAFGSYSHAEGMSSTANGSQSHAEGLGSVANGAGSHAEGNGGSVAYGDGSHAEGSGTRTYGGYSHAEGQGTEASGFVAHAEGIGSKANAAYSHAEGQNTIANNQSEHASGQYNVSSSASTTFGDSGNTLFSVGNGTDDDARHNAFEIRQNGDIYIVSGNSDIKLQDHLGGGTVDQVLDDTTSASTNAIATQAVYSVITDNELVWTNAYVAMSGIVSAHTANTEIHVTAADKEKLHTHSNKTALDSITGNVGTMAYQNANSYSSATEVNTALGNKANTSDLNDFFDDAKYEDSGTTKVINFYHGNTIKATIDASDFIVDGMVDDVRIENGNLVIDFNTASGKQDISIPLTDIFDPSNYYDKDDIDTLVGSGFTSSSITDVIIENEQIVSASLTDLDERKLDASAYTPSVELWEAGSGANSVVLKGSSGTASGDFAVAEGNSTSATSFGSHAEGTRTIASGRSSHAEGAYTIASGNYSHAEGDYTIASGNYSHAEGSDTIASGVLSHAEGLSTSATSYQTHAEGSNTVANGQQSHAEGYQTSASGNWSHSEGNSTKASGASSHAEGSDTIASGQYSHAEGFLTSATSVGSHAEGTRTIASGTSSHAEGERTIANGMAAHAEGYCTSANTNYSHAEGYGTIVNNNSEHASGEYNVSNTGSTRAERTLFSVGNGNNNSERHNAFEIRQNGDIYIVSGSTDIKLQDNIGKVEVISAITPSNSGSTSPIATKVVAENELTVSNALNDLNARKLDASAYTPTDLSNYYTKSETSGATEISNALDSKADKTAVDDLSGQTETIATALVELHSEIGDIETLLAAI